MTHKSLRRRLSVTSSALLLVTLYLSPSVAEPTQAQGPTQAQDVAQAQRQAQVISPAQFERREVGQGKAMIEVFKEGRAAFLGRLTLAPHAAVPRHRDPTEEYLMIESGSGVITLDGAERAVKAGDVIYMPARAEVSFKNGPEVLRAIQVFAGPESARKYDRWRLVNEVRSRGSR